MEMGKVQKVVGNGRNGGKWWKEAKSGGNVKKMVMENGQKVLEKEGEMVGKGKKSGGKLEKMLGNGENGGKGGKRGQKWWEMGKNCGKLGKRWKGAKNDGNVRKW